MSCISNHIIVLVMLSIFKTSEMIYLDMTHELKENIPRFPGIIPLTISLLTNDTHPDGYWFQVENMNTCVHIGTHMDAPCHLAKGKWCISEIPFERLIAPAVVIDITKKMKNGSVSNLMPEDLKEWENEHGKIPDNSILILKTGWGKFWNEPEIYVNGSGMNKNFPGISQEAAIWLVNNTKIYGVGVETVSLDEAISKTYPAHVTLFSANIYGIENLANVEKLPIKGAVINAMPIKIGKGSGAPARVFAKLPDL